MQNGFSELYLISSFDSLPGLAGLLFLRDLMAFLISFKANLIPPFGELNMLWASSTSSSQNVYDFPPINSYNNLLYRPMSPYAFFSSTLSFCQGLAPPPPPNYCSIFMEIFSYISFFPFATLHYFSPCVSLGILGISKAAVASSH